MWIRYVLLAALAASAAFAQLGMFSPVQRLEFTREWSGDRFPDGRPKVPGRMLDQLAKVKLSQAWETLSVDGYRHQFAGGWTDVNPEARRLVGRVVTAVFLPFRPDVNAVIDERGKQERRIGPQNSWIIDILQPKDVLVVDLNGTINLIGDNLATSIFAKTGRGLIIHGGVRDLSGIRKMYGFRVYLRQANPDIIRNVMLMGINVPIRIGDAVVMPGDVAVGGEEGVLFVPPHLAGRVAAGVR